MRISPAKQGAALHKTPISLYNCRTETRILEDFTSGNDASLILAKERMCKEAKTPLPKLDWRIQLKLSVLIVPHLF